jgi:RNA polymerase sigma-70 factor (ECF subfamily)
MRPELIQATELLRRNTPEAVAEAIGLLQGTVYSFSMKVCGHPEDAEDTMQEVLFRSLAHLAKIQEPQALAVWLYTVTRNRCWRMRRKSVHAPKHMLSLEELMPDAAELGRLLADVAAGPEDNLLHAEQHHLLHQAVLRIPAQLRIVLVLHDMEELNTEQVAQILGLQTGTVRVRLHRARLAVRKEMSRVLDEAQPNGPDAQADAGQKKKRRTPSKESGSASQQHPRECSELFAGLSEYLDGRVETRTCAEMNEHIAACPACVAFLRDLRQAIDRCRTFEVSCDPAVAQRLRSMLTQEYLRMIAVPAMKQVSPVL